MDARSRRVGRGGRWKCHRRVINGILFRLRTGIPWRTTKIHLVGEGGLRPLALLITPGRWGDAPQMIPVLDRIRVARPNGGRSRTRPDHLSGDRAYSSRRNRRYLRRRWFDKRAYVFHDTVTVAAVRLWLRA
ncbi:transposase [Streptomyces sp. NPDC087300]|uniref:transposase n=1 Tax=Streptomyces sp. NPDC087300 TaxID=3365780 RepID=UPI0038074CBB